MRFKIIFVFCTVLFVGGAMVLFAADGSVLDKPKMKSLNVGFNGETIKSFYTVIDARSPRQRAADKKRGHLAGDVVVFFQGHGQRPTDAYKFTSKLALKSKSGIVIIPVSDTPYGKDKNWRGDRGKDVILMEVVRYLLYEKGIYVDGYRPVSDMPAYVNDKDMLKNMSHEGIHTRLSAVGWSHGGILARRFAHTYPEATIGLAHVCPAGYAQRGVLRLVLGFGWESIHTSTLSLKGYAGDVFKAGWGITRGVTGDFIRAVPSAAIHLQPSKLCRPFRDIKDCTLYCDDTNLPVPDIDNLVVIFGDRDSCMDVRKQAGISDPHEPSEAEVERFWSRFYPSAVSNRARLTFKVLPGMHLAPVIYSDIYSSAVLEGLNQPAVSRDQ
ncbi:MAG: alpha/beta hydrolase [Thermodesulfobacteriota bacterium]|nr:alpha/beta hydrolase [Thermodesulfobacteriota bacterium]